MARFKRTLVALTLVGAFSMVFAGIALGGTSSKKDCSVCQFKPAIPHTQSSSTSTTTTKSHTHISKTLRAQVTQYERVKKIRIAINGGPRIKSGIGCIDPTRVKAWKFHAGQSFDNADRLHRDLPDYWKAGRKVCNWHIQNGFRGKKGRFVVGTKDNCSNQPIGIPIEGTRHPRVKFKVYEVTLRKFHSDYDKVFTKTTTTSTSGGTTTTYSCAEYGSQWTLTTERGSAECKYCPPTPCPTPTPPPPPSKAHAWLSKSAIKDGASVSLSGGEFSFSITVNGTSTGSTTNAASGSNRDLGQFNPGDSVQVCETNTGGYTPDLVCISHTMAAGENFTFTFVNRKTSPPPPSNVAPSCTMMSQPQNGPGGLEADGETFPGTASVTGTKGDPLVVTIDSPLGNTVVTSSSSFTSNGLDTVSWLYTAPNDSGAVGKSDQITMKVTDTKTGLYSTCSTAPFVLNGPTGQV